jgi:NRAMP (natural resistance-associated macrophage protein)-like metal ion transporter
MRTLRGQSEAARKLIGGITKSSPPIRRFHRNSGRAPQNSFFAQLGPGLITGASDDDPSGIATYSQAGAQFGYGLCWVMLFCFPLMAAIQEISARIGRVTGQGIAANIRVHYPAWLLYAIVALLLVANIINLGADLGAMAAALKLLIGGPAGVYVVGFAVFCAWLEIFARYERYTAILKWTSFVLLAYVAVALVVPIPWRTVLKNTFVPSVTLTKDYIVTVVAVLGTTITPYCFFWQSSEEALDERVDPAAHSLLDRPAEAPAQIRRIRIDTYSGMAYSNLVSFFIIVSTAATLHAHGVTNIETSSQAAEALRPIAGVFTFALFAGGIIGIGLLAVPVLAGAGAYAVGEALQWTTGLDRKPRDAAAFYATIALSTLIGIGINFIGLDPIKALFWSAVLNGVIGAPLMAVIMLMAMRPDIMGDFILPRPLLGLGWLCTFTMAVAVAIMFATW